MGTNNVIDELSLQINANANSAISNLNNLQNKLRGLAKSVGTFASSADMAYRSLGRLGHVNTGSLGKSINELERLSKIDLSNLENKTIKMSVQLTGASESERKIHALEEAARKVDVSAIQRNLVSALDLDENVVRASLDNALKNLKLSGKADIFDDLFDKIANEPAMVRLNTSDFNYYVDDMRTQYDDFLEYIKNRPFHVSSGVSNSVWSGEILGRDTGKEGYLKYFEKYNNEGRKLNGDWQELTSENRSFSNLFTSDDRALDNEEAQISRIIKLIKEAKAASSGTKIGLDVANRNANLSDDAWHRVSSVLADSQRSLDAAIKQEMNKSLAESANKIPLAFRIDPEQITRQIEDAIKKAEAKQYKVHLDLYVDTSKLKTSIKAGVDELDLSSFSGISTVLQDASRAMADIALINPKESGLSSFINSLARLSSVDMSKFNGELFNGIVTSINEIAKVGDISASINRLVSSLARLANAGDKTGQAATDLPRLGAAIREVVTGLASAGGLPAELNAFVSAIAQLASAGAKTGTTAEQLKALGEGVKSFIENVKTAPEVSEGVQRITESIAKLASSGGKAGTAVKSIGNSLNNMSGGADRLAAVGNIVNQIGQGFSRVGGVVKQGVQKIVSSFDSLKSSSNGLNTVKNNVKSLIGAMVGFRGIQGVFAGLKDSIMKGADVTEINHIIESVFSQDMVGYVEEWSHTAIEQFGIAEIAAKRYAGTLSAMFQASKIGQNDAGKMGMDLTSLAGDLSAFYNIDTETAFNKIRSGMAGMVRPLRDLGIDLTAATLGEYALSQGIQKSYQQMSQAEKVMLRYNYLMSVTKTQQGDFQRTSLSLANSLRTLKAYASAVSSQIGVGLGAALRHVVVWLNTVMKYVLKAATAFATFMQTIFGKYKGGASGMAVDMSMAEDSGDSLADSADSAADGLGNATDNAKKLKKELSVLPFDELNQLNKDVDSASNAVNDGGSGGGGGTGGLGDITDGLLDWEDMIGNSKLPDAISEWGRRIKAAFNEQDWNKLGKEIAWGINKGIDKVYDILDPEKFKKKVAPFIDAFTTTFNSLIGSINWGKLGRTVARGVNDLVFVLNRTIEGIKWGQIGAKLSTGLRGFINEVDWRGLGNLIGNKFMIFWKTLDGFVTDFTRNNGWQDLGKGLAEAVNGINEKISWTTVAHAITTGLNGLFTTIWNFTNTIKWDEVAQNIFNGLNTAIHNFHWKENGQALGKFISDLCDTIIEIVDNTDWTGIGQGIADFLQQIPWGKMLTTVGHAITKALGGILTGMMKEPAGAAAAAFITAFGAFKIGNMLNPFVSSIITALTGKQVANPLSAGVVKLIKLAFSPKTWYVLDEWISTGILKVGSLVQTIASSTVGASALMGGALGGTLLAAQALSKGIDKLKGGNGVLTDQGTILHTYIDNMSRAGVLTKEQSDSLATWVENNEEAGISMDDFVRKLQESGVSYDAARGYLDAMATSSSTNATEFDKLSAAVDGSKESFSQASTQWDMSATSSEEAFDKIRNAVWNAAQQSGEYQANYDTLMATIDDTETHAQNAEAGYLAIQQYAEDTGLDIGVLNAMMANEFPEAVKTGVTDATGALQTANTETATETQGIKKSYKDMYLEINEHNEAIKRSIQETAAGAKTGLDTWQNDVTEFYNAASEKLKGIGEAWGNLDTEQEQTLGSLNENLESSINNQQTAINNMQALNEESLDKATVQAIIKQIDPSSQAMTDLVKHMQADDQTWRDFHANLQESMSLTNDLDAITTEFAKEIAPKFVEIGDDFKVEGGKIGGFLVAGTKQGIYDNIEDAKTALDDLASFSLGAFNKKMGINSPSTVMKTNGMYIVQGLANGITGYAALAVQAVNTLVATISGKFSSVSSTWNGVGKALCESIASGITTNTPLVSKSFAGINGFLKSEQSTIKQYGTASGKDFVTAFKDQMDNLDTKAESAINSMLNTITGKGIMSSMTSAGKSLAQALSDGFESVDIATPHLYVSDWDWHDMGDGQGFSTPVFGVSWYKAGGLFRNASVIGVGEAGDEAVLPLTNRRTMNMIADSIVNASGGMGVDPKVIANAVADGVAEAMISVQGNQQSPIFHIEVKTEDNETLARAVTRGQRSIDYRNNPVPQM